MKRALIGITLVLPGLSIAHASYGPVTTERGARATLTTASTTATVYVNETAPVGGEAERVAYLELVSGDDRETHPCVYTMSDDPVIRGTAELTADCATYHVVARFTISGGGTARIPLLCALDFSRPSQTEVTIDREGTLIVSGTTNDSRVWTNTDLGTCGD